MKDMNGNIDWSMCREYWVPVRGHRCGGPTFTSLMRLLGWLNRNGYDGVKTFEVMALNPEVGGPIFVQVPAEIVRRWMGAE